ncbi:MAG: response regulator [Ramlibacter sp.]
MPGTHRWTRFTGDSVEEQAGSRAAIDARATGEVVLLVEDDPTIRQLLAGELDRAGYRVIVRNNGAEGLEILQSDARINLLLTDVGLPGGLNGRQVADAGRVKRPGLRVLFITGYADAEAAVGGGHLPDGMEVITKPFDVADLVAKVGAMLG